MRIYGLPEFDRFGHQYEYMLIEEEPDGYHAADIRTEKFNGNLDYRSTLTNAVGTGNDNRILVMKEWLDDGDIQHRRNVAVQAYQKEPGNRWDYLSSSDRDLSGIPMWIWEQSRQMMSTFWKQRFTERMGKSRSLQ